MNRDFKEQVELIDKEGVYTMDQDGEIWHTPTFNTANILRATRSSSIGAVFCGMWLFTSDKYDADYKSMDINCALNGETDNWRECIALIVDGEFHWIESSSTNNIGEEE